MLEALTVRRGARKGEPTSRVGDAVRRRLESLGRERRLVYLIAMWTGLRRAEIKQLQWSDIDLDSELPQIRLRAGTTKSRRGDTIVLHPQVAEALRAARPQGTTSRQLVVSSVPCMKTLRADLKLAEIDKGDKVVGFVDFHSPRMTLSTMMAAAGMSQRSRQSHMRHTDPRLTENTYMDERLLPVAKELAAVPSIPLLETGKLRSNEPVGVPSPCNAGATDATDMHHKTAGLTLELTAGDNATQEPEMELTIRGPTTQVLLIQAFGQLLSSKDKASHELVRGLTSKRAKGFEPSTFTLAT